jgi:hypothetical protein
MKQRNQRTGMVVRVNPQIRTCFTSVHGRGTNRGSKQGFDIGGRQWRAVAALLERWFKPHALSEATVAAKDALNLKRDETCCQLTLDHMPQPQQGLCNQWLR